MNIETILEYLDDESDLWDETAESIISETNECSDARRRALINRAAANLIRKLLIDEEDKEQAKEEVVIMPRWFYMMMTEHFKEGVKLYGRKESFELPGGEA